MSAAARPSMAHSFLEVLAPDGEITFQTIAEGEQAHMKHLNRVFHGTFEEHTATLLSYNNAGAGVFYMVNRGDGVARPGRKTPRSTENVIAVRAVFVDLDGSPLEPVQQAVPAPTVIVESSPGRWHAYWKTHDCPLEEFTRRQGQLAARFRGDPSVTDLPRVMRLPGFLHRKRDPFLTRVIYPEPEKKP